MNLYIFSQIAAQSLETYLRLLAIPQFARYVRACNYRFLECFKSIIRCENKTEFIFNNSTYLIKYNNMCAWFKNGYVHREIFPAMVFKHGTMVWCQNGIIHRDNDQPAIIYNVLDGKTNSILLQYKHTDHDHTAWYKNGHLYRKRGPAVIYKDGREFWYRHGVQQEPHWYEYKKGPKNIILNILRG